MEHALINTQAFKFLLGQKSHQITIEQKENNRKSSFVAHYGVFDELILHFPRIPIWN